MSVSFKSILFLASNQNLQFVRDFCEQELHNLLQNHALLVNLIHRFATVGALVVNEDCSDLDNADAYKEFYIRKKQEQ